MSLYETPIGSWYSNAPLRLCLMSFDKFGEQYHTNGPEDWSDITAN